MLHSVIRFCSPRKVLVETSSTHPWMTNDVIAAFEAQAPAYGTSQFNDLREVFFTKVKRAKAKYFSDLRSKIASLEKNDKRWWTLNRELLGGISKLMQIPSLRDSDGIWITDPAKKAQLFMETW